MSKQGKVFKVWRFESGGAYYVGNWEVPYFSHTTGITLEPGESKMMQLVEVVPVPPRRKEKKRKA